jgi:CRP/FNR family transcriptional regulator
MVATRLSTPTAKQRADFFSNLTPAEADAIRDSMMVTRYRRGETIFHAGDPADYIFLIETGMVKVSYENANGDENILMVFQSGDLFGDLFFGKYRHRVGNARALEDALIGRLSEDQLIELIRIYPSIAWSFIQHLADEHRETLARVHALMHVDAEYRLLGTLLNLARRHCCSDGDWFRMPTCLNQEDIANIAGMNRSTASKLINEFRRQGLLGGSGRVLTVNHVAVDELLRDAGVEILE